MSDHLETNNNERNLSDGSPARCRFEGSCIHTCKLWTGAKLQTAKIRFLKNLGSSDDYNVSLERNEDAKGREERLSILKTLEERFDV